MTHLSRQYSSNLDELAAMRQFVRDSCLRAWGSDAKEELLDQIELALQEAAANIVLHAYAGEKGRPIELVVELDPDLVRLTLYHQGKDFAPDTVTPPVLDGSRTGGFGLYLIEKCMDEVRHIHNGDGKRGIQLTKKRASLPKRA